MSKNQRIGTLASKMLQEAMKSGMTWDESVAALGLTAKALADQAARESDGTPEDCRTHAKKRFEEGFAQNVQVIITGADISRLEEIYGAASPDAVQAVMANTNTHIFLEH